MNFLKLILMYSVFGYGVLFSLVHGYALQWLTVGYGLHPMIGGAIMLLCIVAPMVAFYCVRTPFNRRHGSGF